MKVQVKTTIEEKKDWLKRCGIEMRRLEMKRIDQIGDGDLTGAAKTLQAIRIARAAFRKVSTGLKGQLNRREKGK